MEADGARDHFKKIRARFANSPPPIKLPGALDIRQSGRELELIGNGNSEELQEILRSYHPEDLRCESLTLEEIFIASKTLAQKTL